MYRGVHSVKILKILKFVAVLENILRDKFLGAVKKKQR